jgi:hypothetical protein
MKELKIIIRKPTDDELKAYQKHRGEIHKGEIPLEFAFQIDYVDDGKSKTMTAHRDNTLGQILTVVKQKNKLLL